MALIKLRLRRMSNEKTEFGKRLREAMRDNGMLAQKGAESGVDTKALMDAINSVSKPPVTHEAVRKWIAGKSLPRPDKMKFIATLLKVNLQWLRDGVGQKVGEIISALRDEKEREIIDVWRSTDDRGRKAIWSQVTTERSFIEERKKRRKGAA